jgi:ferredoxin
LYQKLELNQKLNYTDMERDIINIDDEKCNGCGLCIPNCHEGALQIVDNKARLVSDLMCDGLGACIGHCPQGAITMEKREAQPYDEILVMEEMIGKGKNTLIAHLKHLKDHNEHVYVKQGMEWLKQNEDKLDFILNDVVMAVFDAQAMPAKAKAAGGCGGACPGSVEMDFRPVTKKAEVQSGKQASALGQWPVQMHLINPTASYFISSDLLLAADCTAFALGGFHGELLKGKSLAIACPKLDHNQEIYMQKLVRLIEEAKINTMTVAIMEVPCCGGLIQMAQKAVATANRKIPLKLIVVGIQGEIIKEEWV